jgi:hypothetical protein
MGKFIIQPHGRLQEWIADEKGYFTMRAGLRIQTRLSMASAKRINVSAVAELRSGAFESISAQAAAKA